MKKNMHKDVALHKVGVLQQLEPRREPYWGPRLAPNQSLGFRRINAHSGSWIARLKGPDGKRVYQALGAETDSFGFDEAHAAAVRWFKLKDDGITGTDLTVKGACDNYVKNLREQRKQPETAHDAAKRFERVLNASSLGRVKLTDLKKHHIQTWINGLKLSAGSLHRTFTSVRAALNLAVRQGHVGIEAQQAWLHPELPKMPDNRRSLYLDLKQRKALLAVTKGGIHDLIEGAMLTGCRAGELTSALCSQFDARTGLMTFVGKTGRRTVPLAPPTVVLLKRLSKGKPSTAHLFTRDDGKPWAHSDWDELVREAAKVAKLPEGVCLYTLRHSFISQSIAGGMNTLEVARMVGTSLQMIEKHYGKLIPDAALKRLAKIKFV